MPYIVVSVIISKSILSPPAAESLNLFYGYFSVVLSNNHYDCLNAYYVVYYPSACDIS